MIFKREFTKKIKLNIIGLVRNKIAAKFCNKINLFIVFIYKIKENFKKS